jgi:hypothetical protein
VKRRQFEEILDECISAYLSGRRSVEDSLSLYPSIARELEPLLRAAADTADTLQAFHPPPQVQERIRRRILQAANERAAARALTRDIDGFAPPGRGHTLLLIALPAVAALVAAIAVTGVFALRDGADDSTSDDVSVSVLDRPEFASNLDRMRRQLDMLQRKSARGEDVTSADLDALVGATLLLAETTEPETLPVGDQTRVEEMLQEQLVLLGQLESETDETDEIDEAVAATVSVAVALGVPVPDVGDSAASTATPRATSSSGASSSPTPSATPTAPTPLAPN